MLHDGEYVPNSIFGSHSSKVGLGSSAVPKGTAGYAVLTTQFSTLANNDNCGYCLWRVVD